MKSLKHIYLLIAGTVIMFSAFAQAPQGVNYQAVARNSVGVMANKSLAVRITILAGSTTGSADYVEKHSVTTNTYGLFNLIMGSGSAQTGTFAGISWGSGSKFLKVEIDTNNGSNYTTLSNTQMMSVPYALYAEKSGSGGGGLTGSGTSNYVAKWSSSSALTDALIYDNGSGVAIGTASPNSNNKFTVSSGNLVSGYFETNNASNSAYAVQGLYTGTGQYDAAGVYGKSKPQDSYGIGGSFEGGWLGTLGQVLNAGDSFYTGTYGNVGATSKSVGFSIGARGRVVGGKGTNFGGYFQSFGDTNSTGVIGYANITNHASLSSIYQRGNAGGAFISNDGQGAFGQATGSYNLGSSKAAQGVIGLSSAASGGYNAGMVAYGTNGNSTCTGIEVYGDAGSGSPTYVLGIVASVVGTGSSATYAGYFDGDVTSTGALSKASGSFKIDHPQDPANKYLIHSFVESPDMMNVYNGNITTDANGTATVQLPTYFMAENKDFRYQLTPIGTFAQVIVFEEVKDNQFVIKTDKPNVKVSWQVTGIRQDAWANSHRIVAEVEKVGAEKGRYIHPALFGKSSDFGIPALTRSYTPSGQTIINTPSQLSKSFGKN